MLATVTSDDDGKKADPLDEEIRITFDVDEMQRFFSGFSELELPYDVDDIRRTS